ncbi:NigD-like protein [Parabacteroides sp. Marseille-P3160]|uniref:NigD-like protein n=1 Tax=Parabacteroides sp. Marseille-P3160 TaxID=1917887 RepID=UPI0009BAFB17|nr:NigD-like protein [Parabacteroides sp. Marseille-P3160]
MKRFKFFTAIAGILLASMTLNSCSDDGYSLGDFWVEVATVYQEGDDWYSLTLDDGTTLWPASPLYRPAGLKYNQRVLVDYTILSDSMSGFDHYIKVNALQKILTKEVAENKGVENDSIYGTDPVKIYNLWTGDGFLNIDFGFNAGGGVSHFVNLLQDSTSSASPYAFEFRHNAYDDHASYGQRGLVAFKLPDFETGEEEITLLIKVKTFEGEKEYELVYTPQRKATFTNRKISKETYSTEIK